MAPDLASSLPIGTLQLDAVAEPRDAKKYLFLKYTEEDLPDFVVPEEERPKTDEGDVHGDLLTVDFAELCSADASQRREIIHLIGKACEEWGFFVLTNHSIPVDVISRVQEYGREFYDLPLEQKEKAGFTADVLAGGYGSSGAVLKTGKMWSESLYFRWYPIQNRTVSQYISKAMPDHHKFSAAVEEYLCMMEKLSVELLEIVAEALGLAKNTIAGPYKSSPQSLLNVNHYPPCPQPELTLGMVAHADRGLITLLTQDGVGGLQVHKDNQWTTVKPVPGAVVVNIGDLMQAISNGRFKSARHRALTNANKHRISAAYFVHIDGDFLVKPPLQLIDAEHPLKYRPFTTKEYRMAAINPEIDNINILGHFEI